MVNAHKGKKYEPRAVYNRKLVRSMIRAGLVTKFGNHHVNKNVSSNFKRLRGEQASV